MKKMWGYIAKDGMLKITTNLETVMEHGVGVLTDITFKKDNPNQAGGNPEIDGKEIFVYGDGFIRVGNADSKDIPIEEYPMLKELYDEIKKENA